MKSSYCERIGREVMGGSIEMKEGFEVNLG